MNAEVSVIMGVCDSSNVSYLDRAIYSVLNQSFQKLEFIVVIDGEVSREIRELLYKYQCKDSRITLCFNKTKKGLAYALNKALSFCTSNLIARMDDDEICFPKRLEIQYEIIKRYRFDILFTNFYFIDENDNIISLGYSEKFIKKVRRIINHREKFLRKLLSDNFIMHPTVMFRKEKIGNIGGYNSILLSSEDYDLWIRAIINKLSFGVVDEPLMYIRVPTQQNKQKRIRKQKNYCYWNVCILKKLEKKLYHSTQSIREYILLWVMVKKIILTSHFLQLIPENILAGITSIRDLVYGYRKMR